MEENSLGWQQDIPPMADLFREAEDDQQLRPGDIRRGVVTAISTQGVTVDIHATQRGLIPQADLDKVPPDERDSLRPGQDVLVYIVTDGSDSHETVQLSLYLAKKEQDWLRAEALLEQGSVWRGRVSGFNKGGLVVPFGHIRAFVPASQISGFPRNLSGEDKLAQLSHFVGQELAFRVVEVNRRQRRLVLSERLGHIAQKEQQHQEFLLKLRRGDMCRGRVRSLTDYGAFLDLGGAVGLIHRTELAWFRVEHPCEVIQEGQEVEAYVLRVNRERGRISLSLKRTYEDPWPTVTERYRLGQLVEGRVIRQTGAGLFVITDDRVLGFIPEVDLRQSGRLDGESALNRRVLTRLVRIDGARRRLGLSLRRVRADEWDQWCERLKQPEVSDVGTAEPTTVPEVSPPRSEIPR